MKFAPTPPPMKFPTRPRAKTPEAEEDARAPEGEGPIEEMRRKLSAFDPAKRARVEAEEARYKDAVDTEFWFAVASETRPQKEAILKALGLFETGDKYLSGFAFAEILADLLDADPSARAKASAALRAVEGMRRPAFTVKKPSARLLALTKL